MERSGAHEELADRGHAGIITRRWRLREEADTANCAAPGLCWCVSAIIAPRLRALLRSG